MALTTAAPCPSCWQACSCLPWASCSAARWCGSWIPQAYKACTRIHQDQAQQLEASRWYLGSGVCVIFPRYLSLNWHDTALMSHQAHATMQPNIWGASLAWLQMKPSALELSPRGLAIAEQGKVRFHGCIRRTRAA